MKFEDQPWWTSISEIVYYSIKLCKLYEGTKQKLHIYWTRDRTHTKKRHLRPPSQEVLRQAPSCSPPHASVVITNTKTREYRHPGP